MPDWARLAPATEAAWPRLPDETLTAVAAIDADRLLLERSRLPERTARLVTEPVYSVRNRFRSWERLIIRMESGWPPDGYYLADEYANDLESRDQLDNMPAAVAGGSLGVLLGSLDDRFTAATVPDDGGGLRARVPGLARDGARWQRVPRDLPWQ